MASLNDIETKVHHIINLLDARTIKTITAVLPITFTTTEDKLRDWEIRGNDESYNLLDIEAVRYKYADVTIAIKDNSTGTLQCSCDGTYAYSQVNYDTNFENGKVYTISCTNELANTNGAYFAIIRADTLATMVKISLSTIGQKSATFTYSDRDFPQGAIAVFVLTTTATASEINVTNMMITLGSTASDHYIPYQQGVGELVNDHYEIPITVNGSTINLPIGNTPLRAGQSISKTSTGVDIATSEGENTISTTLYNKPEMTIKYK